MELLGRYWWWPVVLVLVHFGMNGCFGCWEQERIALLQFKASIVNYANEYNFPHWDLGNKESDCCEWERVKCNIITGRVIQLTLNLTMSYYLNRESGGGWYFNASLFLPFEDLQYLDLSLNGIRGWVPNEGFERFSALSKLEVLHLDCNNFNESILSSLSGIASLKELYLWENDFNGSIQGFERFSLLSKLEVLYLGYNNFNNSILQSLSGIASLKELDLSNNNLNGSIHIKEFKAFSNLEKLYLNDNKINDFVTTRRSNILTKLQFLDLSYNNLEGFLTTKGSKNFGKLQVLHLGSNKFSARIFESLSTFPSLKMLNLRENNLKGSFTIEELRALNNLEELYLDGSSTNDESFVSKVGVMSSLKVLTMMDCGLNGSLSATGLCELRNLREISLSYNHFEGILPSCMANWTSLHFLDLSDNHFSGNVQSLSNLRSLEFLSLSNNEFLNPIAFSSFFNLSNLKILLSDNNKIAFETDSHTRVPTFQLRLFSLSKCSFNGLNTTLPTFLHYQYDLQEIDLSHNNLKGKFPNWLLENNTRLEHFILRNNSFTGLFLVPDRLHPNITEIDISSNCLQGPIPTNLGLIFPNLQYLNMADNAFQGSIPSSFGNWVSLWHLDLSKNNLSGTMPVHFTLGCYSLQVLKLSNNNFYGQIFPANFNLTNLLHLYLDNNHFSGKIPNSILKIDVSAIDFSNNNLSGMLPVGMGNMSNLRAIVMANNQLEGLIPIELCKLDNLELFDLSENNLSGLIPSCFNSSTIQFFHLNKNSLSGPIPSVFPNNSNLVTLNLRDNYLSGNIPKWIGSVSSLSILLLGENHLEGRIPIQLCLLQKLNLLDLSFNKISGPIPHCLSNLTFNASADEHNLGGLFYGSFSKTKSPTWAYLLEAPTIYSWAHVDLIEEVEFTTKSRTYSYKGDILNYMFGIDLSCNMLVGEIPPQLGRISSNIRAINLSHNYLTGSIPITFSNLKQMESLDLSYNNLNGKIPPQLTELTSLEVFSVAHNNLSGQLPDRKYQFGTFDENSYEGNPHLCGPPLHKDCTKTGPLSIMPVDHMEEKNGSFMDIGVFYISFVVAYIIVLLGIVIVFYINPYWRKAWFNLIEECIDTCYCFVVVYYHKLFNFRLA